MSAFARVLAFGCLAAFTACRGPSVAGPHLSADPEIAQLVGADGDEVTVVVSLANTGGVDITINDLSLSDSAPEWVHIDGDQPVRIAPGKVGEVVLKGVLDRAVLPADPFDLVVVASGQPVAMSGCRADAEEAVRITLEIPVDAYLDSDCDRDGDGFLTTACEGGDDCDDDDESVYPGATEYCDGLDNDCDGTADDDVVDPGLWYPDDDADGYGTSDGEPVSSCEPVAGHAADDTDCDDADFDVHPGADEICDGLDNDCDTLIDIADPDVVLGTFYWDGDGDGHGEPGNSIDICFPQPNWVVVDDDCDDDDVAVYPGADELCDGLDQDCDGVIDNDTADGPTWYEDLDGDGYGDLGTASCVQPSGTVADGGDCDESDPDIHPGAAEICDGIDNDCTGIADDGGAGGGRFFLDSDGDGFGDARFGTDACVQPVGYVAADTDCDDADPDVNPDADEICDNFDNDCNGLIDDDPVDPPSWYSADSDGDGWGDPGSEIAVGCIPPVDALPGPDCEPSDAAVHPEADELCDGIDQDCDGVADNDAIDGDLAWLDLDADGYGDPAAAEAFCGALPTGYVRTDGDCDDLNPFVSPGETEFCDGRDNDCDGDIDEPGSDGESAWYPDFDGDSYGDAAGETFACDAPEGFGADGTDCDDLQPTVHPSATELCDGLDNDCNGLVDDGAVTDGTWMFDGDLDGFGDPNNTQESCGNPGNGWVLGVPDCDDADPAVNPLATEICDGLDNDCDGTVDVGATDLSSYWLDGDGDGYGDPALEVVDCVAPSGYVADNSDCDDLDFASHPGADEVCGGGDEDCDGTADEPGALGEVDWYLDADGDTFGDPADAVAACQGAADRVLDNTDCDDGEILAFPGGIEVCDGLDNDCSGVVDDFATDGEIWSFDGDLDGYGDPSTAVLGCGAPGFAWILSPADDCDDTEPTVHPGAIEVCDGLDNDCDGDIDDGAADASTWYLDADTDGYGDASMTVEECAAPAGYVSDATDCDDGDNTAFPGATEICDGDDEDCDGAIDESGAVGEQSWYADVDGDNYGDATSSVLACDPPVGHVADDTDCDDTEPTAFPGGIEICDGIDNDCSGIADDNAVDGEAWMRDGDGDGFGDPATAVDACAAPSPNHVNGLEDCDDTEPTVFPGATELCDGLDNDCDGDIDLGVVDGSTYYADGDGDTYGDPSVSVEACVAPAGFVDNPDDCADADASAFPGATEICDGDDEDCDGDIDESGATGESSWYADADGDGFGDASDAVQACTAPAGRIADATDCDDGLAAVHPGADELCNGIDDDCDGPVDESAVDGTTYYADGDGDSFGDDTDAIDSCAPVPGRVTLGGDCADADAAINPLATEICDGADNDCDGTADVGAVDGDTYYVDGDGDGFGLDGSAVDACSLQPGFSAIAGDCDDTLSNVWPGAPEFCDGVDSDCNGVLDDDYAADVLPWYHDSDGDGFGDASDVVLSCDPPADYVGDDTDCNDANNLTYPGAFEMCDGVDNDCDGTIDNPQLWYQDNDGDGFGNSGQSTISCFPPPGFVATDGDCNDGNGAIYPGAPEICDFLDNNCDGVTDTDALDARTWYADGDADGFGAIGAGVTECIQPPGWVDVTGDCEDANNLVNPGAPEVCDAVDNNCVGGIDEGSVCICPVEHYNGHAYAFCGLASQPFATAVSDCGLYGYDVVSIQNLAENNWLQATAALYNPEDWWIGLNDQLVEGSYVWVDGSPVTFTFWEPGQPDNFGGQDCTELDTDDGRWNDTDCSGDNNIICESP